MIDEIGEQQLKTLLDDLVDEIEARGSVTLEDFREAAKRGYMKAMERCDKLAPQKGVRGRTWWINPKLASTASLIKAQQILKKGRSDDLERPYFQMMRRMGWFKVVAIELPPAEKKKP